MSLPEFSLKNTYIIIALALVIISLGSFAFWRVPTDLFPDTVPPQVVIVTAQPGAAARDVTNNITRIIEKELVSLSGLKRIVSTSRDEVSSINVEFVYAKSIGEAVIDVQNAISRIRGDLPQDTAEPGLYRITDATRPLVTLALSPGAESLKSLADIRLLAENDLKDRLLSISGVGDVQVFGGYRHEVEVHVDRDALIAYNLTLSDVISLLALQNVSAPGGTVYTTDREHLIRIAGEFDRLDSLSNLPLKTPAGGRVYLRNIASVELGTADRRSIYHGNGINAVAVNVLRPEKGQTVAAINNLKQVLPDIQKRYPDIHFAITDDQQPLIDLNVSGMRSSLWQAVVLTVLVILAFLSNLRAAGVVSVAIPLSFLSAMVVLWFSPYTLNMVTLSGLIVAVGMVVDASVVVLENIYRHYADDSSLSSRDAAVLGAQQVAAPITAGMLTTVIVLIPVLFAGGYTGQIMQPLNIMIISTLVASLLISLSVIPIMASRLLGKARRERKIYQLLTKPMTTTLDLLTKLYLGLVKTAINHRILFLGITVIFLIFTMRVVKPLLGGEQMPPMDTGIAIVEFDTNSSLQPQRVEAVLTRVESMLQRTPEVESLSAVVGSEIDAISFGGGGGTAQAAKITVHLSPRTERSRSIWQIEEDWRQQLPLIEGLRTFRVSEYGATPVSTTKAPFNIVLSGPDTRVLDRLADKTLRLLRGTPGLQDLRRTWYQDKAEQKVVVDHELASLYATSPASVATVLRTAVQGRVASTMALENYLDIPIRVRYQSDQVQNISQLEQVSVPTSYGPVPLNNLASIKENRDQPFLTRENLTNTIDITGGNQVLTIAEVTRQSQHRLKDLPLPAGYTMEIAGTLRDMNESGQELGQALIIGLVLLFILLLALFRSFIHPFTIMLSIPLAAAGGMWGLLAFNKPFCMPALMGIILLGGTIVNNAILMLDFILAARRSGISKDEAILQSVQLRLRPILMTAVSTVVGFSPLIFEMAVGLERMSPLGIAAASGLLFGTVVTLVIIPVIYSALDSLTDCLGSLLNKRKKIPVSMGLLLIFFLFSGHQVRAMQLPAKLSFEKAVEIALQNNPDLGQVQAQTTLHKGKILVAAAPRKLQVNLESGISSSKESHAVVPGLAPAGQIFDRQIFQTILSARFLLTDFGRTRAALEAATANKNASLLLEQRRKQEIIFSVAREYLTILALDDLVQAAEASRKSLYSLAQKIDLLVSQGKVPQIDRLKIQIQLAEIENVLVDYRSVKRKRRAVLAGLLGLEGSLPPLLPISGEHKLLSSPFSTKIKVDPGQRADVAALEEDLKASQFLIKEAQLRFRPELELWGSAGIYGAEDPMDSAMQAAGEKWEDDVTVGIRLTIPLLDGHFRNGKLIQSKANQETIKQQLKHKRIAVHEEFEIAHSDLESSRAKLEVTRRMVIQAQEAQRIEQLKYEVGKGTITSVLDSEADFLKTQSLVTEAKAAVGIARLALSLARGNIGINSEYVSIR
ncbi:MAG: efflux RND transporter permease subunit [Desulfuromonadales bacterium]|nr:efflux RND transporter permease subunit [Desulfuromonadales bacterium]MBN2790915.1 efflux RND transporter permease subunit [Desulfuromonadales bacterium]